MIFTDANVIYEAMSKAIKSGARDRYIRQLYEVKDEAGLIGTHEHMQLVQIVKYEGKWWFVLRELTAQELEMAKLKSDVAYTAMMSGVDLDD